MQSQSRRNTVAGPVLAERDQQTRAQVGRAWLIEMLALAALIAVVVVGATWFAQPQLRVDASSPDATRWLVGFWQTEHNQSDVFRWSQAEAGLRLFGFEQAAPIILQARLTTVREPGQPPAQLTIDDAQSRVSFTLAPTWRVYHLALPAPPRGDESPLLSFHSSPTIIKTDSRDLGFVLSWIKAAQAPLSTPQWLPDPVRVVFLVLLGSLIYLALRRAIRVTTVARLVMLALLIALGVGIAVAPGMIAYWLPNVWFALLAGGVALFALPLVRELRRGMGVSQRVIVPLGLLALIGAQALLPLHQPWSSGLGWALLISGGVLLAAGLQAPALDDSSELTRRTVALALLACTALALALRLVALNWLPLGMWRDEARHGLLALRILHDPSYRPVYVPVVADIPALLFYLAAVPIAAFGQHPWTVRLVPALAGALTPLALYWATRPIFGARLSLLAAALLTVSVWHIALSRLAFAATLGPPLTALAVGLMWRTLQAGPPRRRYFQAVLAGACSGLAIYTYHPSRLTPLVVSLVVLVVLWLDWRAWLAALPRLILALAVMFLILWPLINYALHNSEDFSRRVNQTFIFREGLIDGHAPAWVLEQNVRLVVGMWNEHGDDNGRHNVSGAPMLDPVMGIMFVAGAALLLTRLRDRRVLVALVWLGVMLIPAFLSVEEPHAVRTVEAIIPTMLLAGIGCIALLDWALQQRQQRNDARFVRGVTVALLAAVLALNSWRYFVTWPATLPAYTEYYVADTHIGELAQRLSSAPELAGDHYAVFIAVPRDDDDVLDYLTSRSAITKVGGDQLTIQPGDQPLLILRGNKPTADQARQLLGTSATLLGTGLRSPGSGQPEFVVYGRGAATPAVTSVLAGWLSK